jgi:hypothetical protein
MAKPERIVPSSRGSSHCSCCSAVPKEQVPQALRASLGLQLLHDRRKGEVVGADGGAEGVVLGLGGEDPRVEEVPHQARELFGLGAGLEVHAHSVVIDGFLDSHFSNRSILPPVLAAMQLPVPT